MVEGFLDGALGLGVGAEVMPWDWPDLSGRSFVARLALACSEAAACRDASLVENMRVRRCLTDCLSAGFGCECDESSPEDTAVTGTPFWAVDGAATPSTDLTDDALEVGFDVEVLASVVLAMAGNQARAQTRC